MFERVLNVPLQYQISLQMRYAQFAGHIKKAKKLGIAAIELSINDNNESS